MKESVGAGGRNLIDDVRAVQQALNRRATALGIGRIAEDGRCTVNTIRAIRRFETFALGERQSNGRIEPGSASERALHSTSPGAMASQLARATAAVAALSGADWWAANRHALSDSMVLGECDPAFALRVTDFARAMRRAGAVVKVRSARADARRAHALHWAWKVAEGTASPRSVPEHPDIVIFWDHGDDPVSRRAARAMLMAAGVESLPPFESAAIDGEAVEMEVEWGGAITVHDARGMPHLLDRPRRVPWNPVLRRIAHSYGLAQDRTQPMRWVSRDARHSGDAEMLAL